MTPEQIMKKLNKGSLWAGNLRDDDITPNNKVLTILTEAKLNWGDFNKIFKNLSTFTDYTVILYHIEEGTLESLSTLSDYFEENGIKNIPIDSTLYFLLEDKILKNSEEEEEHTEIRIEDRDTTSELHDLNRFINGLDE